MKISKITIDNKTLIDLSSDTVESSKLTTGYTAHDQYGNLIIGTSAKGGVYQDYDGSLIFTEESAENISWKAKIASGTITGAGSFNNLDIFVGKKMPRREFMFVICAPDGSEFPNNTDYNINQFYATCYNMIYDLSSNADPCPATTLVYNVKSNGNTHVKSNWYTSHIRNNTMYYTMQGNNGYNRIKRDDSGFYIKIQNWNASYQLMSGLVYDWALYYFGSDPINDIVEVI